MNVLDADFSGLRVRVSGLEAEMSARLAEDWAPFLGPASAGPPLLDVEVGLLDGPAGVEPFRPKRMTATLGPDGARFGLPQGDGAVQPDGQGRIRVRRAPGATPYFTMMNLLRACLAWRLPSVSAAMLHAAGLVVDGRAFVLAGPEGAGKTTWVRLGQRGGGEVLSDDLVLVQCGRDSVEALGSPFHSRHPGPYRPGRWPLAAILFPRHGSRAAWRRTSALLARARLAANLPFVAQDLEADGRIASVLERLAAGVPCGELTFALDPGFVDLLRGAGPHV